MSAPADENVETAKEIVTSDRRIKSRMFSVEFGVSKERAISILEKNFVASQQSLLSFLVLTGDVPTQWLERCNLPKISEPTTERGRSSRFTESWRVRL